jgi:hypothetical protein
VQKLSIKFIFVFITDMSQYLLVLILVSLQKYYNFQVMYVLFSSYIEEITVPKLTESECRCVCRSYHFQLNRTGSYLKTSGCPR